MSAESWFRRHSPLNAALYAFEVLETKWIFSLSKRSSCISMKYVRVKRILSAEESPDDLDKNHQVKVDAHLVM